MSLVNKFSNCNILQHSSGDTDVLECVNNMGHNGRHFIWQKKIAMCEYHYCFILNGDNNEHNTISCSGVIMRFEDDNTHYFNPLTPYGLDFKKMLSTTVDYFAIQYEYYFQDDVRSTFALPITNINCTNDMRTCITFNDTSLCFGNVEDITIIHSTQSLIHGILVAFTVGIICYIYLKDQVDNYPLSFVFAFYITPLIAIGMIYTGWFLSMSIPFLIGNSVVLFLFTLLYYPIKDVLMANTK